MDGGKGREQERKLQSRRKESHSSRLKPLLQEAINKGLSSMHGRLDNVLQGSYTALPEQNNKKEEYLEKVEYHAWFTNDPWITHKIYKNVITNTYHEVSYVTKEKYNHLPFHVDITYVGMIHV